MSRTKLIKLIQGDVEYIKYIFSIMNKYVGYKK